MTRNCFKKSGSAILLAITIMALAGCAAPSHMSQAQRQKLNRAMANAAAEGSEKSGHKASLATLEAAYKRNSNDAATALNYAQALRENGRLQRSAIVLDPFIQDNAAPTADLVAEYGAIQAAMSNYSEAETYARKAVALDSNSGQGYHVLGIALDAEGKHDEAEVAFRRALDHWQGDPSPVLNNLGLNLAAQGFLDEAVETLRKAAADSPDSQEIKRNLRIVKAMQAQSPQPKPVPVPPVKPSQG